MQSAERQTGSQLKPSFRKKERMIPAVKGEGAMGEELKLAPEH